jgi:pimeloyl-ACP methyl ester carboxylesterase/membrane protein DedA with SNARE-associated domain
MSRPVRFLVAYLFALAVSTLIRVWDTTEPKPDAREKTLILGAVDGDRITADPVRLAYLDSAPAGPPSSPVVVLLHGSPGDNGEVTRLGLALADRYRVLAPDLPGFGGSSRSVPDYSIRAHARYVAQMLDSLKVARAHLLGFSLGGGVALELAELAPGRVASITMLSAIGVQEFELLGDYHLNHAVHALQLGGLWLLYNAVPHFGAWDGGFLSLEYARNFYDSDQRPLRGILNRLQAPMLIVQGKGDDLVPPPIAPEHARIVPQSELLMLEGSHFMAFQRPGELAVPIADFIARAEAGTAATRATATPNRIRAAALPFDPGSVPPAMGIGFVVLLLLIAASTLVSEDLTCIATGLLVSRGTLAFGPGVAACFLGIVGGDLLLYAAGRYLGRPALQRRPLRWLLTEADLARTSAWFDRTGPALILTSRFVPGTRLPTYVAAGLLHTRFLPFLGFFLLAAAVWTPLLVGLAVLYGEAVLAAFAAYRRWSFPLLLISALVLLVIVKVLIPLFTWRGRRLLLSRWRRLTRWEFWPPWVFYPPVAVYVLWLGVRHRSPLLFTAANPGMPGGGVVGESKWHILRSFSGPPSVLPAMTFLPGDTTADQRRAQVDSFMAEHGLGWPLVLKPDVGERGAGVAIVRSRQQLHRLLEHARGALLVQEYLPGREYGIFYHRTPDDTAGRIFSITDKRLPTVTGDGVSTLEALILRGERTVCIARMLLQRHATRLWDVPVDGEVVALVDLGTHCRGAAFFDGTALRTATLEAAVDRVSRDFSGFYFGRYDVRAESDEALQQGRFKVIELNGVASEATSIYDPRHRLIDAYRILKQQWRIAFEIGAANRAAGARPATLNELRALLRTHRAARRGHPAT